MKFNDRNYISAQDAYPGEENSTANGKAFSTVSWGGLSFNGSNLCCFNYAQNNAVKNQFGFGMYLPSVSLKEGTEFVTANASGIVGSGQSVLVAPTLTLEIPIDANDCSTAMSDELTKIKDGLPLPTPLSAADQNVKAIMPARPDTKADNSAIDVLVGKD